jgi:ABC-2 type transport system ATP-binding protein
MTTSDRPMIELCRLRRHFGKTKAVEDVSFAVYAGQVFGYIGPNGAGKTTSMRILATLDVPTSGDAFVDGFSVVDDPDRVRRRLGFMPDYFGSYPNVNVEEYLDFFARAYQLPGDRRRRALAEVMEFTGLGPLAEKPINGLSKGMGQRLCLGRALIHDPAVLVLDEPAAGLDPRARIELREMIRALANRGKTVLISSHILTELAEICDLVGILERGRLVAVGTVEEIQAQGQTPHEVIQVEVLGRPEALAAWLQARPGVSGLQESASGSGQGAAAARPEMNGMHPNGRLLRFLHTGDAATAAELLRAMVEAGFPVASFARRRQSLEDVFMQVTKGLVQ